MGREDEKELILLVGRMDGKLDLLVEGNESLTRRVSALEKSQARIGGVAAALSAFSLWVGKDQLAGMFGLGSHGQ